MQLEVVQTRSERRRFVELARRFRGDSPHFVPPLTGEIAKLLDPRKNPSFAYAKQTLWIARDAQGKVCGRIAATYDPRHAENLGENAGWFGFFDADQSATAKLLIKQAWQWQQEQGATCMLGPADPDTNHECGCLIEGYEEIPYMMMPHQPLQYASWLQDAGCVKAKDLLAFEAQSRLLPIDRLKKVVNRSLERGGFELVPITKKRLPELLESCREIYNGAWKDNWGFLPMSQEEFHFEAEGLKMLLDSDLACIAFHKQRPAGFILALRDVNLVLHKINSRLFPFGILRFPFLFKKVGRMRTVALGIQPEFRNRGLEISLIYEISKKAVAKGVPTSELSWVLEDNEQMIALAKTLNAPLTRRYRIYRYSDT